MSIARGRMTEIYSKYLSSCMTSVQTKSDKSIAPGSTDSLLCRNNDLCCYPVVFTIAEAVAGLYDVC